jgi:hypothetical protein
MTGLVNQELLLRNEYMAAENRILRAHLPARLRLSDGRDNLLLFPIAVQEAGSRGAICCRERLGGLLKYYSHAA